MVNIFVEAQICMIAIDARLPASLVRMPPNGQQSVFLMLPADRKGYGSNGDYFPLKAMVNMAFFFQLCWVAKLLHHQCTADVFLIDWEKVRLVRVSAQLSRGSVINNRQRGTPQHDWIA